MGLSDLMNAPGAPAPAAAPSAPVTDDFNFDAEQGVPASAPAEDAFSFEEQAASEPEPAEEEAAEPEAPAEPEEVEEETPAEDAFEDAPEEEAGAPVDLEADHEAKFKLGEEVLTAKEVKARLLMREDYTRKTQVLAAERKSFQDQKIEHEIYKTEVDDLLGAFEAADTAELELAAMRPDVFKALERRIVERYIKIGDMSEDARSLFRDKWKNDVEKYRTAREQGTEQKATAHRQRAHKSAELVKNYNTWRLEGMKAVGLDPDKAEHFEAVTDAMVARHRGKPWTKELFDSECSRVGKLLNVKAPKPAKKDADKPAAKKAPLPQVRAVGNKRPATPAAATQKRTTKGTFTSSFADIRSKYGVR